MDDFKIDARRWRFLDNPDGYVCDAQRKDVRIRTEPLVRQFKTVKEILSRLQMGRGVLLADDVGLGKTTIGALVAWAVACQDKRVRIFAPNDVMRRRWAEELERHIPMLSQLGAGIDRIKQGEVGKLNAGRIQVATHHTLIKIHSNKEQRTACDLMIIDEAHRAKGDGSAFNKALNKLGEYAKRKLILTATPFSIRLEELEQLLKFVGATELKAVQQYDRDMKRLYSLGEGHDVTAESKRLVNSAREAISTLRDFVIRHSIDDIKSEQMHFGSRSTGEWEINTPAATQDDLKLLLRMDRLLHLAPERKGERRNDPRFHVGWQHFSTELERLAVRASDDTDNIVKRHIKATNDALRVRQRLPHPKVAAVTESIRRIVDGGDKVLVFCHHRATANEVLEIFEQSLKTDTNMPTVPPKQVWRAAWQFLLCDESRDDDLTAPIIDWLCTPGLRSQISNWIGEPAAHSQELADQLARAKPRCQGKEVPTILAAAKELKKSLLDSQSTSTRALLRNISTNGLNSFGGKASHFPGRLDEGIRVMGAWDHDGHSKQPKTLYTGSPDIVLALFNSPFGPDVLVATDRLSEGVDLHRYCRYLVHYELDPSPVRTIQREGRVRRINSWAAITGQPICYAYPYFRGTRDERAVEVMRQRINAFGLLLGGVPPLNDSSIDENQCFADKVLGVASTELKSLNRRLGL